MKGRLKEKEICISPVSWIGFSGLKNKYIKYLIRNIKMKNNMDNHPKHF
jgi:hypothetical protein